MINKKFKLEKIATKCFLTITFLLFSFLTYLSLKSSWINASLYNEFVSFKKDNIVTNILLFLLLVVIILFLAYISLKIKKQKVFLWLILSLVTIIGLFWIMTCGSIPIADQYNCMYAAHLFNDGDYSWLNKGRYLALNPHLLGLVTLYRVIDYIVGSGNYFAIRLVNLFLANVMIYAGYRIVDLLSVKNITKNIYLILSSLCLPMYGYIVFIYGEIPSITFVLLSVWMFLEFNKTRKNICIFLMFIFSMISILMKQNSLIIYIGLIIATFIKAIENKETKELLVIVILIISILMPSKLMDLMYPRENDAKAIPSLAYVAMGLNQTQEDLNGWFNSYNYSVYEWCEYDRSCLVEDAKQEVENFISNNNFAGYANFFINKISTQWNAPDYQFLSMNSNIENKQGKIANLIYNEGGNRIAEGFCNTYQLLIYVFVTISILYGLFKDTDISVYSLLIGIFGGFLFSLIWEAKTRYIFPYFVMLIPYATLGIEKTLNKIEEVLNAH